MAIQALNDHGEEAAAFFANELFHPANEEAEAWLASLWEPQPATWH